MSVRVRFAPSPTGHVHIGNIRVAIFNWLFARHENGKFLLRIEDTDLERSTPEAIKTLLDSMSWLGLDYDEEPVYQTKQLSRHREVAAKMIEAGFASKKDDSSPTVFRITEKLFDPSFVSGPRDEVGIEIGAGRLTANANGITLYLKSSKGAEFAHSMGWGALPELRLTAENGETIEGDYLKDKTIHLFEDAREGDADVAGLIGLAPVKIHFKRRYVFFDDIVMGRLEKPLDGIRDFVVVRSDGSPVFHLANVIDDVDMNVTPVLRGNDHVENTFRHLFLYRAMGEAPPRFGHFPMIVNEQGKPYSKRDGAAYVGDFREMGFFPECLFNMLALCGWNPGDDREIMSRAEMIDAFSLDHVNSGPAQFSLKKIHWMNSRYFMNKPAAELIPEIISRLEKEGVDTRSMDEAWLIRLIELLRVRAETLAQFVQKSKYFFAGEITPDPKAVSKVLLKNDGAGLKTLKKLKGLLEGIADWSEPVLEETLARFAATGGIEFGDIAQPLRVAVTGGTASPGIWETLFLVGKAQTLARIEKILRVKEAS
jgi:glutamyl-tRNA synthetase